MAKQIPLTCSGHTRPVVDLSFSKITRDGYFSISACKDGKPMLRQGETGDWIGTFIGHKGAVWAATLNNDATKAASGAADFTATLWDAVNGDIISQYQHKHIVKAVAFSHDCSLLLTGGQEKMARCFSIEKPEAEPDVVGRHEGGIKKILWAGKDNSICITASEDKTIRKWDLRSQKDIQTISAPDPISDIELSDDGKTLLTSYGHHVAICDASSFQEVSGFNLTAAVFSASMHPKRKYIVAGGDDFKIYKYDFETLEEQESYKGHFGPVHIIRFSPDGELYASGSEDGTVRLWQTHVGTNYGLWQCDLPTGDENSSSST